MKPLSDKRIKELAGYDWLHDEIFSKWLVRELSPLGRSLCDVGAGDGSMLEHYDGVFARIVALEPSKEAVRLLRLKEARGIEVLEAYAEGIPLADSSVDIAFAKSSYHHFKNPETGLREMARVAKNAIAIVEVVAPGDLSLQFARKLLPLKEDTRSSTQIFTSELLIERLAEVGDVISSMLFDQHIDIKRWLDHGDLNEQTKNEIWDYILRQPSKIRIQQQIRQRQDRWVMLRRNCLVIAMCK